MTTRWLATLVSCSLLTLGPALAQRNFDDVKVEAQKVADGVYMLTGSGGNLGACVGKDGVFLIDDQFAPLTEKIQAAVAKLAPGPIRFVLNTHWHGDHTGGNENLGKAGALIVAHDNVRVRMSVDQFMEAFDRTVPASPEGALPVVTFNDSVTFHLNDQEIHAFHVPPAHTDGDSMVHFRSVNVLHMGDVYFKGLYPFIDVSAGGSIDGVIAAVERALKLVDAETKIIPGHGSLATRDELLAYRDMLRGVRDAVAPMVKAGKSLEEVTEAKPSAPFDEVWGQGFMTPDRFVAVVYDSLSR